VQRFLEVREGTGRPKRTACCRGISWEGSFPRSPQSASKCITPSFLPGFRRAHAFSAARLLSSSRRVEVARRRGLSLRSVAQDSIEGEGARSNGKKAHNGGASGRVERQESIFINPDYRFHSTSASISQEDYEKLLPRRIFLVRHGESKGNLDMETYTTIPDRVVPLTRRGFRQSFEAGEKIKKIIGEDERLFIYTSPYKRSKQTAKGIEAAFPPGHVIAMQEEVQLREQEFGNFQDLSEIQNHKDERMRYGRFFYRFPNGESGADVYDRLTLFEDHLIRDMNAGRFGSKVNLVLVTHGLALRIFLMRWFHWTVEEFEEVYNPDNAEPIVLERRSVHDDEDWVKGKLHTKMVYQLSKESAQHIKGCTEDMCMTFHSPRVWTCSDDLECSFE